MPIRRQVPGCWKFGCAMATKWQGWVMVESLSQVTQSNAMPPVTSDLEKLSHLLQRVLSEQQATRKIVQQFIESQPQAEIAVGIAAAAEALHGVSNKATQARIRRKIDSGAYRQGVEWFDASSPDSTKRIPRFFVGKCRERDLTEKHLK